MKPVRLIIAASVVVAVSYLLLKDFHREEKVDFNAQIRPIFNQKCITCHGGVKKNGGFSLLFREDAMQPAKSGLRAIIPGDANGSELIKRLVHQDPEERMPLEAEPLSPEEIKVLKRWIDQGANWEAHWAYLPPNQNSQPPTPDTNWIQNGVDAFIYQRLRQEGLKPSPRADKAALLRRLSLDLVGLPPTLEESGAFLNDHSPDAYEKQVDRLLASPRFGERWASMWLDLARYADSKGYEKDLERSIWKYRDWVIDAFNRDMPFDQFTIEQLAGDLLQTPTESQYIATAFHRNSTTNDEGGTNNEEFRNAALVDRVSTTWEVWQGTTMACVQCHSHPYDPFRHEDFYKSLAFFNNSEDRDLYNDNPKLYTYTAENERKIRELMDWITVRLKLDQPAPQGKLLDDRKRELLYSLGYRRLEAEDFDSTSRHIELTGDQKTIMQTADGSYIVFEDIDLTHVCRLTYRYTAGTSAFIELRLDSVAGPLVSNARLTPTEKSKTDWWGWKKDGTVSATIKPTTGKHSLYFVFRKDTEYLSDLFHLDWIKFHEEKPGKDAYGKQLRDKLIELDTIQAISTLVMRDRPPGKQRRTFVFERGNWLVHGKQVNPGVPGSLPPLPANAPKNRLGLAKWLVSANNPLTARVIVNRFWEQLFGYGIVETMEDFGTQGFKPTHPELLDWLAIQLIDQHHWSVKKLLKQLVMSATYQQSAAARPELIEKDPRNLLLARGPRVRLSAEQIRDQALAVSGLLSTKMHGPSVRPPVPTGIGSWKNSLEEDRYRRAVYTFWQRTNPYPSMVTFDSPIRNLCTSRRIRTNTPLQALVTLNDTVYFEAAQHLAEQMAAKGMPVQDQLSYGYQRVMLRKPSPEKLALLGKLYQEALEHYRHQVDNLPSGMKVKAPDRRTVGTSFVSFPMKKRHQPSTLKLKSPTPQLAALTLVANALLNLDEFLTK